MCHMLNATMCATTRVICCILENYQTEEGIKIPEVLRPFMPSNMDILKFVKPAPIDEEMKKKGKSKGKDKKPDKKSEAKKEDVAGKLEQMKVDS